MKPVLSGVLRSFFPYKNTNSLRFCFFFVYETFSRAREKCPPRTCGSRRSRVWPTYYFLRRECGSSRGLCRGQNAKGGISRVVAAVASARQSNKCPGDIRRGLTFVRLCIFLDLFFFLSFFTPPRSKTVYTTRPQIISTPPVGADRKLSSRLPLRPQNKC